MTQRGISRGEIDEALDNVGTSYPSEDHPDRTVNLGECKNGRRLKVVVLNADPQFVVTVADRDDQR